MNVAWKGDFVCYGDENIETIFDINNKPKANINLKLFAQQILRTKGKVEGSVSSKRKASPGTLIPSANIPTIPHEYSTASCRIVRSMRWDALRSEANSYLQIFDIQPHGTPTKVFHSV